MNENHKQVIDWGLMLAVVGLLLTIVQQTIANHERLARIEQGVLSETTLCDCFNTRARVGALEQRLDYLEKRERTN